MRLIGKLESGDDARRFGDFLLTIGIRSHVEQGSDSAWQIWIEHDDQLDAGTLELRAYRTNPNDPRYSAVSSQARRLRAEEVAQQKRLQRNYTDVRTAPTRAAMRPTPITLGVLLISILIFIAQQTKLANQVFDALSFYAVQHVDEAALDRALATLATNPDSDEIDKLMRPREFGLREAFGLVGTGQVWRLVTPALMHGNLMHILFNGWWLLALGSMIERRKGSGTLLALVLLGAIIGNSAEASWSALRPGGGYGFLGLSGVVYALFGYAWMRGKYAPHELVGVNPQTVGMMLAWLALCMTGLMPIANAAHVAGLIVGVIYGVWPRLMRKQRR